MDSRHHHDGILDFKIDSGHWRSGHYCMQSGLSILSAQCWPVGKSEAQSLLVMGVLCFFYFFIFYFLSETKWQTRPKLGGTMIFILEELRLNFSKFCWGVWREVHWLFIIQNGHSAACRVTRNDLCSIYPFTRWCHASCSQSNEYIETSTMRAHAV